MDPDRSFSSDISRPSRILVVDDHELVRLGLSHLIRSRQDWELCGEAEECLQTLQMIRARSPDLAIVDLRLAKGDGLDLVKRIRDTCPSCRVLVFSALEEDLFAQRALEAGAHGFINKLEPLPTLMEAIEKVLEGRVALTQRMTDRLLAAKGGGPAATKSPLELLSNREMEVFEHLGQGLSAKEVARELHLSVKTIEYHRQNIQEKLQLSGSRAVVRQATAYVLERANGPQSAAT